jgi:NAD(P)-dependent dehydrogenase (short-subunit alcohol dehydrogenase family)
VTLNKKVAVITGSSSGIGYETALMFARNGYTTYATMRNIEKGSNLKTIVEKENGSIKLVELDVTSDTSVKGAIDFISSESGRIDVLINNAGYGLIGALEDLSIEEIKSQFETNFFGIIRVTQAVMPFMRSQRFGKIVNISSVGGRWGFPFMSAYVSTKFAIEGLTESLSMEVEPFGIKLILIEPGVIKTNIANSAIFSKNSTNPDLPYYQGTQSIINRFSKFMENASPPELVAKIILDAVSNDNPKLRYAAGMDAQQGLENRKKMTDEEFFNMIRQM